MAPGLLWISLGLCCLISETTVDVKYEDKKKKIKIRVEVQEYPNQPLKDAFMNKLPDNGNKTFLQ
jgi:hypothetical protein